MSPHQTLLLLLMVIIATTATAESKQYSLSGIEDGDTLIVAINGQPEKIQLLGIDAPEATDNAKLKHDIQRTGATAAELLEMGKKADEYLRTRLSALANISINGPLKPRDRYGRIPADAKQPDGQSLPESMVAAGYAVVLHRYPLDAAFKQRLLTLEQQAREQSKGLWVAFPDLMMRWSGQK